MRIGFDIDGVLADFISSYERLFVELTGRNTFPAMDLREGPNSWNWPTDYCGYTAEETKAVWARIKSSVTFWQDLASAPQFDSFAKWFAALNSRDVDLYFVTARPGRQTKAQTEDWFHRRLLTVPTVLISDQKGAVCKALDLNYYVDDRAENIADVVATSPNTKAYLLDRAYNRHMNVGYRLANLEEFLQVLNGVTESLPRTPMAITPHD